MAEQPHWWNLLEINPQELARLLPSEGSGKAVSREVSPQEQVPAELPPEKLQGASGAVHSGAQELHVPQVQPEKAKRKKQRELDDPIIISRALLPLQCPSSTLLKSLTSCH